MTKEGAIFNPETNYDRWLRAAIFSGTLAFSLFNPAAYLFFFAASASGIIDDLHHFDKLRKQNNESLI